jgi:hypothetical protein
VRKALLLGAMACLAACGGPSFEAPVTSPVLGETARVGFADWEARWLGDLGATDLRIALRLPGKRNEEARERASAEAVVRGADVWLVDGAIDVFSFDERARRLSRLRGELRAAPPDASPDARAEKMLLERLVDAEELRVAGERQSPESASERVRAIVATWGHPMSTAEVEAREREVTRGLLEVIGGVRIGRLSRPRILELEDELDPLERLAIPEGYPEATGAITGLRVELGKAPTTGASRDPVPPFSVQLVTYLGVRDDRDALVAHLDDEEATLRRDAKAALAGLPEHAANDALSEAASHVDMESPCPAPQTTSLVRAMHAPPERALVCDVLRLAGGAQDVAVTIALHDDVAIALWAFALENGATDLDVTRTDHPLIGAVPHDRQDRLVRAALVSPARAIAPGLAVTLLDAAGPDARQERAKRWLAFGDAPFDLVAEAVGVKSKGE